MTGRGRPLRFFAMVVFAWVAVRVAMLWPQTGSLPAAIQAALPLAHAAPRASAPAAVPLPQSRATLESRRAMPMRLPPAYRLPLGDDDPRVQLALMGLVQYGEPEGSPVPSAPRAMLPARAVPLPERLDPLPDRWSLSSWVVVRGGGGAAAAPGGQIGGGQAGIRAAWLLAPRQRLAAYARLTAPLQGRGREAALGFEWQPTRVPVRLIAEQRFGLDGNPGGTGLGAITGIDTEWRGFRLEAYGQAGVMLRRQADPYADGAARGVRIVEQRGPVRLGLGAGAWGAAQRDSQRLDLGPSATLAVRNLRLALDWRQRVAGEAKPGSGLALTLGADF